MPKSALDISPKKLYLFASLSALFVFVLGYLAVFSHALQTLDQSVEYLLAGARTPAWNGFFLAVTYFGSVEFIAIATAFLAAIFLIRKDFTHFTIFLGTILANAASVVLIKDLVERARPVLQVYAETSFSFPSGHTSISVVFYGFLAYIAALSVKSRRTRMNFLFVWIFAMLMIGFSRIYLGVHFMSDVLAGYAVGFFWLSLGIASFERLFAKKYKKLA